MNGATIKVIDGQSEFRKI